MSEFTVSPTPPPQPVSTEEDRTVAIVAYITVIGFFVALILNSNKKTALGAFHLRQVLGFIVGGFAVGIAVALTAAVLIWIPFIGPLFVGLLWFVLWAGGLVLVIMGLVAAIQGKQTPVPIVGAAFQKWFANVFN